ncbi:MULTISPECIES: barstar family protein [unclassified Streptomyces]|uniref:barstar family protein n=1 Tax=unclassified Streptomyces TaxID=2593676 RepID=UPI002DDA63B6|nr:barstar family protein [Streptomyces sp. NBC_00243]WRZ17158.1 barstar family protein [Streptomyces sp. NBC_00243]
MTVIYVLDGTRIRTLEDFWRVAGESIGCGGYFGRNLDAFADCLRGGFGTPDDGDFAIEWRDHEASRQNLGHTETARQLELWLPRCHPTNKADMTTRLAQARAEDGPTAFDWLVDIIEEERPGGLRLR